MPDQFLPRVPAVVAVGLAVVMMFGDARAQGESASRNADGSLPPREALATLQIEKGLRIELVAAEPLVVDPVAIAFDERGRMYVAEDRGYPTGPGKGNPPAGIIALLEDTTGDGHYDRRTVFAEGLTFPNGVMVWKGGVFVTCAPDLFYLKDTNGDGKADVKKVVFTGFQHLSTTQLRVSHPLLGLDNWVYLTSGLTSAKVTSPDHPNRPPLQLNRTDFRFRPDTDRYEATSGTTQFGQTFDRFGRRFICSNRNHIQHVVLESRYLQRNPHFQFSELVQDIPEHGAAAKVYPISANVTTAASHTGYFTAACGLFIYEGALLPEEYRGNAFVCEPAGNLVHRDVIRPDGATFAASRAHDGVEFLASTDDWFRPVNLTSGPDGALYICDMYRKTIEHPDYLPEHTRKITDFESGKDKGRIYRIVPEKTTGRRAWATLADADLETLCDALGHPDMWHRMTAHRLLLEREQQDAKAAPALKRLAQNGKTPEARIHGLRLLEALGALGGAEIRAGLVDSSPEVQEHALQLAEAHLDSSPDLIWPLLNRASDADPRVRFQTALTLGQINHDDVLTALARIAAQDRRDKWTRAAVLSSVGGRAQKFLRSMMAAVSLSSLGQTTMIGDATDVLALVPWMGDLGRILGADTNTSTAVVVRAATGPSDPGDFDWQLALLTGFADGLRGRGTPARKGPTLMTLTETLPEDAKRIAAMAKRSEEIAVDVSQALDRRVVAVGLLAHTEFQRAVTTLEKLIDPRQAVEIQTAAVRALGQMGDAAAARILASPQRWNAYTPSIRDLVTTTLLGQPQFLEHFLSALERGDIPALSVDASRRNQLVRHKDEAIRARAVAVFENLKSGDRMKEYEEYKSVLSLERDPGNGRLVYARHCASCHVFAGEGSAVGPDLTGIRSQPDDVILLHIMVPEFEIMPIYQAYVVETKDGGIFDGLLAAETASSITLRRGFGEEETILRAGIASMTANTLSLMPQEMEKNMSRQELADLIGFLKGEE